MTLAGRAWAGWVTAGMLLLGASHAHAWSFRPYNVILSAEAGPQDTMLRYAYGTRRTPQHALHTALQAEVVVLHSPWHPHRLSVVGGVEPSALFTLGLPDWGARPGLSQPFNNTGLLKDPGLGLGGSAGVRYRWETSTVFVPFLDADVMLSVSKVLRPAPLHLNLAARVGGGVEYHLLHRYALFAAFHLRGGPLLWPLPALLPWPEAAADAVVGMRFRAF